MFIKRITERSTGGWHLTRRRRLLTHSTRHNPPFAPSSLDSSVTASWYAATVLHRSDRLRSCTAIRMLATRTRKSSMSSRIGLVRIMTPSGSGSLADRYIMNRRKGLLWRGLQRVRLCAPDRCESHLTCDHLSATTSEPRRQWP